MLEEKIKSFANRIETMQESINTEEATKTSLIMPFFSMLGYDVFNPTEFVPEGPPLQKTLLILINPVLTRLFSIFKWE